MEKWFENCTDAITVTSRVRLARNLGNMPFPGSMSSAQMKQMTETVKEKLCAKDADLKIKLHAVNMADITDTEAFAMVERHLISPNFANNRENRVLLLSDDETVSIMLGEEDHIRIQVLAPGFALNEAYAVADSIDNYLCDNLPIAYDEGLGFLTECPTNLGTGLRASVMLHLPALQKSSQIDDIAENVSKIGLTMRGTYGEGSKCVASLYQISNQITLGISEEAAIKNLSSVVNQIVAKEEALRNEYDGTVLADYTCRALGILKNARLIDSKEMMELISRVKLGIDRGFVTGIDKALPVTLMFETQPNMLALQYSTDNSRERDEIRARILRERLS